MSQPRVRLYSCYTQGFYSGASTVFLYWDVLIFIGAVLCVLSLCVYETSVFAMGGIGECATDGDRDVVVVGSVEDGEKREDWL